jgi:hypothetical protein
MMMMMVVMVMMMMMRVCWLEWEKVAGRLDKIGWLYRICIPYEYFYVSKVHEDGMDVIHGIGVKYENSIPNVSGKT